MAPQILIFSFQLFFFWAAVRCEIPSTSVCDAVFGSLSPVSGYVGSTITVIGSGFITGQACSARVGATPSSGATASSCSISSDTQVVLVIGHGTQAGSAGVELAFSNLSLARLSSPTTALTIVGFPTWSGVVHPAVAYRSSTVTLVGASFIVGHSCTAKPSPSGSNDAVAPNQSNDAVAPNQSNDAVASDHSNSSSCAVVSSTNMIIVAGQGASFGSINIQISLTNPPVIAFTVFGVFILPSPVIDSITPRSQVIGGSQITVVGQNFLNPCSLVFVSFSSDKGPDLILSDSSSSCNCTRSSCITASPLSSSSRSFFPYMQCSSGFGNPLIRSETFSIEFTFLSRSVVHRVTPNRGVWGSTVTVRGSGFVDQDRIGISIAGNHFVVEAFRVDYMQMTFVVPHFLSSLVSGGASCDLVITDIFVASEVGRKRNLLSVVQGEVHFEQPLSCSAMVIQAAPEAFSVQPSVINLNFPVTLTVYGTNFMTSSSCQASMHNTSTSQNASQCFASSTQLVVVVFESSVVISGNCSLSVTFSNPTQQLSLPIIVSDVVPKLLSISESYIAEGGSIVALAAAHLLPQASCSVSSLGSSGWFSISSQCTVLSSSELSFRLSYWSYELLLVLNVLRVSFSNTGFPGLSIELSSVPLHTCTSHHCTIIPAALNVLRIVRKGSSFTSILPPVAMTAGTAGIMTVFSFDEFRSRRSSGGELFYIQPSQMSQSFSPLFALDHSDGSYSAGIVPRLTGPCTVDVLQLTEGSLVAQYFDSDPSSQHSTIIHSEMQNSIDIASGSGHVSYSAVRWAGYLRPNTDMIHTLHVLVSGGVRIWIDNDIVLNRSASAFGSEFLVLVNISFLRAHHLVVDYLRHQAPALFTVKWSSNAEVLQVIPSKNFLHAAHVAGSPFSVFVSAGPVSRVSEVCNVVTVYTAGVSSFLRVSLRDVYGNAASYFGSSSINLLAPELQHSEIPVSDTEIMYELSFTKAADSTQISVQLLLPSALHATVYSYESGLPQAQFMTSSFDMPLTCSGCFQPRQHQSYTFRWAGFIYPSETSTLTFAFFACDLHAASSISLHINGISALQDAPSSSYIIGKAAVTAYMFHPISLTFNLIQSPYNDFSFRAYFLRTNQTNHTVLAPIPPSMLFAADHLRGSPFDAAVSPAAACASLSVVSFVTVATVGVPSTFILQVKDSFRNILHCDLNDWVHFFGMEWIPGAYSTAGSLCSFTFSPSIATAGHANFYVGSGYALSQPVLLSVLTGRLDFTRSAVQISSLMTAGTYISFTLVLVDSADNAKQLQNLSRSVRLLFYDANQPLDKAQAELQPAFVPSSAPPTFHFTFTTSSRFSVCVMLLDALLARAPLVIVPSSACASTSSMLGKGFTIATNGRPTQFSIGLRDAFGNAAYLDSSVVSVFVYASTAPRFSVASVSIPSVSSVPISLRVFHAPDNSAVAAPVVSAALVSVGGLTATYFADSTFFQPSHVQLNSPLAVNYQHAAAASFVRFAGLLAAAHSGRYTFSFAERYSQTLLLRVDGLDVLKRLPDGSASSVYLEAHQLHPISAEIFGSRPVQMPPVFVKGGFSDPSFIDFNSQFSTDRLYSTRDVFGSPQQLHLQGGTPCAAQSSVSGQALSLCTFGSMASFTVTLRDAAYLPSSLPASYVSASFAGYNQSFASCSSLAKHLVVCSFLCGSSLPHESLVSNTSVVMWLPGEISAQYHSTSRHLPPDESCPVITRTDERLDVCWGRRGPYLDTADDALLLCQSSFLRGSFRVDWRGFILPKFSEVVAFSWNVGLLDSASLFIDDINILNSSATNYRSSATVFLSSSQFYSLYVHYTPATDSPGMQLKWSSASLPQELIPSASFFSRHVLSENTFFRVAKECDAFCMASGSVVTGNLAAAATAGVPAAFNVHFTDAFVENSLLFFSPSFIVSASSPDSEHVLFQRADGSPFIANSSLSFLPSSDRMGGLTATFYGDSSFSSVAAVASFGRCSCQQPSVFDSVDLASKIDSSNSSAPLIRGTRIPLENGSWSVRYAGWLLPSIATEMYTFFLQKPPGTRVSLFIDGIVLIDNSSAENPSSTYTFSSASFAPIEILYSQAGFQSSSSLKFMYQNRLLRDAATFPSKSLCSLGQVHRLSFMPPALKGTYDVSVGILTPSVALFQWFSDDSLSMPAQMQLVTPLSSIDSGAVSFILNGSMHAHNSHRWSGFLQPHSSILTFQIQAPVSCSAVLWLEGVRILHIDSDVSVRTLSAEHNVPQRQALLPFKFECMSSRAQQCAGVSLMLQSSAVPSIYASITFSMFTMEVHPSAASASLSQIVPSGTTFTAGVPVSIALHIKDAFGNLVMSTAAVAICPSNSCSSNLIFGNISNSIPVLHFAIKPVIAGPALLLAAVLQSGAWMVSVTVESTGVTTNHTVKPEGSVGSIGKDNRTASFKGFVRLPSAITVSFRAACSQCYDVILVSAVAAAALSHTIAAAFGRDFWYVEVSAHFSGAATVTLSVLADGSLPRIVSSSELHWLDDMVPSVQVSVLPGAVCAALSSLSSAVLATSGLPVLFSITALDDFLNPTNGITRTWFLTLSRPLDHGVDEDLFSSLLFPVSPASSSGISYFNRVSLTASGYYRINVNLVEHSGFHVDCFLNPYFDGIPFYSGAQSDASLPHRAQHARSIIYSSHIISPPEVVAFFARGSVWAQIFIDGALVLNGNCSFSDCSGQWTPSVQGHVAAFSLKVSSSSDIDFFQLTVSSLSFSESSMVAFFSRLSQDESFLRVLPDFPCASLSLLSGSGLTQATAGQASLFHILPRDKFGNSAEASVLHWHIRSRCVSSGSTANACFSRILLEAPLAVASLPRSLAVTYIPTLAQGTYFSVSLFDAAVAALGLSATVYADSSYQHVLSNKIISSNWSDAPYLRSRLGAPLNTSFASVLRGTIMVNTSSLCAVTAVRHNTSEPAFAIQLSVFVLSEKVVEVSGLSSDAIAASGKFFADSASRFLDIDVYYAEFCTTSCRDETVLNLLVACSNPSSNSFHHKEMFVLPSLPSHCSFDGSAQLSVDPATPCASSSVAFGSSVSLATAGILNYFSIRVLDVFGNSVQHSLSQLLSTASLHCPTSALNSNATVFFATPGSVMIVQYMPRFAGAHSFTLFANGETWFSGVISVVPGSASALQSSFAFPTIATAGQSFTVAIVLRDDMGNLASHSASSAIVCSMRNTHTSEYHSVAAVIVPSVPDLSSSTSMQPSTYACTHRVTTSGRYSASLLLASAGGILAIPVSADSNLISEMSSVIDTSSLALFVNTCINRGVDPGSTFRFSGYVRPIVSGPHTFLISSSEIASASAAARLWFDDAWLLDSRIGVFSGSISLDSDVLYEIFIDLTTSQLFLDRVSLDWSYSGFSLASIPTSSLFTADHLASSPFAVHVEPHVTCGTFSLASSSGVSLASAGAAAEFTLMARDHLGNRRFSSDDIFVINSRVLLKSSGNFTIFPGTVTSYAPGLYTCSFSSAAAALPRAFQAGFPVDAATDPPFMEVYMAQALTGGLSATYYNTVPKFSTRSSISRSSLPTGVTSNYEARFSGFLGLRSQKLSGCIIHVPASAIFGAGSTFNDQHAAAVDVVGPSSITLMLHQQTHFINATMYVRGLTSVNQASFSVTVIEETLSIPVAPVQFHRVDFGFDTFYGSGVWATYYSSELQPVVAQVQPDVAWMTNLSASAVAFSGSSFLPAASGGVIQFEIIKDSGSMLSLWLDGSTAVNSSTNSSVVVRHAVSRLRNVTHIFLFYTSNSSSKNLSISFKALSSCNDDRRSTFADASCIAKYAAFPMQPLSSLPLALTQSSCSVHQDDSNSFSWPSGALLRSSAIGQPRARGPGLWQCAAIRVAVLAGRSDVRSTVISELVTLATAGVPVSFFLALKDASGNPLESSEPVVSRIVIGSSWYTPYLQQPSLNRAVYFSVLKAGSGVVDLGLISQVGNGVTVCVTPSSPFPPCSTQSNLLEVSAIYSTHAEVSVSWSGFFAVDKSDLYQFYVTSDAAVVFSISGASFVSAGSTLHDQLIASVSLQAYNAYAFNISFNRRALQRQVSIKYSSSTAALQHIPPAALHPTFHVVLPPLSFQVQPALSCATTSVAWPSTTVATAGVPLIFHISLNDEFGNARFVQHDVNADCRSPSSCKITAHIQNNAHAASALTLGSILSQSTSSVFMGSVTPTVSSTYSFAAALQFPGGLCATYYRSPHFLDAFSVEFASATVLNATTHSRLNAPLASARWRGFISLNSSCSVTFLVSSSNSFSIVLDSSELLSNRPDIYNTETSFIATSPIVNAAQLSEVLIEYTDSTNPGADFSAELQDCSGSRSSMTSSVSASFTSYAYMLVRDRYIVTHAAAACASSSLRTAAGRNILSAGVPSTFSVILKDAFGNLVSSFDRTLVAARAVSCGSAFSSPCSELIKYTDDSNSSSCRRCPVTIDADFMAGSSPFAISYSLTISSSGLYKIETLLLQPGAALQTTFRSCSFDFSRVSHSPQALVSSLNSICALSSSQQVDGVAFELAAAPSAGTEDVVVVDGFLLPPANESSLCIISSVVLGVGNAWFWMMGSWLLSASQTQAQIEFVFGGNRTPKEFYYVFAAALGGSSRGSVTWSCSSASAPLPAFNVFLKQPISQEDPMKFPVSTSFASIFKTSSNHGLSAGDAVVFDGLALPFPLSLSTVYYIIRGNQTLLPNEFQISAQRRGGSVLAVSTTDSPLFYSKAFAFGPVPSTVSDSTVALMPKGNFSFQDRVPVSIIGAGSPFFQQPRVVMAVPSLAAQNSIQLRYWSNLPVLSFEVLQLVFLVPVTAKLLIVLPVTACASLSSIRSSNGNSNFWIATAGSPVHFNVTLCDAFHNVITDSFVLRDLVPFYSLNGGISRSSASLAFEALTNSPSEEFCYVLKATMIEAGNYTIGLTFRSSRAVAAAATFGCVASVVCASRSVVSYSQQLPVEGKGISLQVSLSSYDSFGNSRAMDWFFKCSAEASATANVIAGDVLSITVQSSSCLCCSSSHVILAGGPAISASPANIHPVFDCFTGQLSAAAVTRGSSLSSSMRYRAQPPVSVLNSALPLLKLELVNTPSSSTWPGESEFASGIPLNLVEGAWNVTSSQYVFSLTIPLTAAATQKKFFRIHPFQLLHGGLLATYYKLLADITNSDLVLSDARDALPCVTAAISVQLFSFQGKTFPNLDCGGSIVGSYAVRYHGFVRRSSAAALTFVFPQTRLGTFFSVHIDSLPLHASPSPTWATGVTPPSQTVTAKITPRSDGSHWHEVLVDVRGAPMTWPPPIPLFIETECRHAVSVVNASDGVFTTAMPHAFVGGEAVMFEGAGVLPPWAPDHVFFVLHDSISLFQFMVASTRLGSLGISAQWAGGTMLILGKCGVYSPFIAGETVLHVRVP